MIFPLPFGMILRESYPAIGGIVGAAIGAASVALPQMIKNVQEGQPLTTNIDPAEVGKAAAVGAVAGVIGGLTFGIGTAVMGSGLGATMAAGAISGAAAGQAARATNNVLSGRNISTGLFNPKDMAVDAVVGGAMAGVGWGIGKYISSLKGGCSFTKDTPVTMKDGEKAIGSIIVGDYVLAWNEADGILDYYPVTAVLVHEDEVLTKLVIDGEWIETTPEHPFYSEEEGWVSADELKTGMHVRQADGDYELVWLKWNIHKIQEMYNLTVDTAHTFFVGDGQWLVHNVCLPKAPDGDTVAILEADGYEYTGVNGQKPISFKVNNISKTHAEIDALNQLYEARQVSGVSGGDAIMRVSRPPCAACGVNGGIRSGVEASGLNSLTVYHPNGVLNIFPR